MLFQKVKRCKKAYALRDTLTSISKTWVKEVPFGSPTSEYPFSPNGDVKENSVILTPDYPLSNGCPELVWHSKSITKSSPDGGYNSGRFPVDNTMPYQRFSYIKKLKAKDGSTYFGCYGYDKSNKNTGLIRMSTGKNNTNPYFFYGDLPKTDQWYLLHTVIQPYTAKNTKVRKGGIYELGNPKPVASIPTEYRWRKDTTQVSVRDYLYYTVKDDIEQYFYLPSIEKMDGSEMPLRLLLGLDVK